MSFTLDLKDGEEIPRPAFFDLQEKVAYLLEEMHENGASLEEKKAVLLGTLASNRWTSEEYGQGLLFWLGVNKIVDMEE